MTDNRELAHRLLDFLVQHPERKFKRHELWQKAFCDDPDALTLDDDTQRRVIGRARELTLAGSYITHAVAANGFTYTYTKQSDNGVDPMLHFTKIVAGQQDVLANITTFVKKMKGTITPENRAEIELLVYFAEEARNAAEIAQRMLLRITDKNIDARRAARK